MAKKDYSNYSKEELIEIIHKLGKKRYGLVWEDKPELLAQECKTKLPVITEDKNKEIHTNKDEPTNIFIEGDNYHALWVLNYTHKSKIDLIYIDPPYNTGNRSWKYNNDFVEKEDSFRHSKWISFMHKRLVLAKKLLKSDGLIVVAIDDYEHHTLRLLMDEIFGENNRLSTCVVVHNPRGRNDDKYFATMHEYMLIYAKNKSAIENIKNFELEEEDIEKYNKQDEISHYNETSFMRTGNNSNRIDRQKLFYPIYYDINKNSLSLEKNDNLIKLLPINARGEEKTWRWGENTFIKYHQTELFVKKVKGVHRVYKKRRITNIKGKKPKTVWYNPIYDASSHGIVLLQNILGRKNNFPYPKSLYSVYDILYLLTKDDSTVLDFFAGSGTTGHAILELNKKFKTNRKFILNTNNEDNNGNGSGIAESICYPRIKKVIEGYKNLDGKFIDGLGGNLKYYKTNFVPFAHTDSDKRALTNKSTEMLCIAEETYDKILFKQGEFSLFENESKITAIIYDEDFIDSCKAVIKKHQKSITIYVFSYDKEYNPEDFHDLDGRIKIKPIPEAILNIYRRIGRKYGQ